MANLVEDSGFAPSEPATTSYPPLPSPPFDAGGFLSGLSGFGSNAIFGMSPSQVGQGFSNFGSGVQSDLSSFENDFQNKGFLGTRPGEDLFPGANEGLQFLASPFEKGGALGGSFEDYAGPAGKDLNQVLQGVAGATDTSQNASAKDIADTWLGAAPALSVVHGAATYGQGVGNLLQKAPELDGKLNDSFQQGLKGTLEPGVGWSNADTDAASKKLMDTLGEVSGTLFDPQLMRQTLYSGFKTNGADETLANNAADALAEPLNFVAQFAGGSPTARAMLAQFIGGLVSDPGNMVDSTKKSGGDFFNLLGTTANMTRGGPPPSPEEISQGLVGLASAVGTAFVGLHVAGAGAGAASRLSYRSADALDRPRTGAQAISDAHDALQESTARAQAEQNVPSDAPAHDRFQDLLQRPELSALRSAIGTENLQQTIEAGEAGIPNEAGQAIETGATSPIEATSGTDQGQGPALAAEEQANQGLQRANLSEANAQPVPPLEFTGDHSEGIPDQVKSGLEKFLADNGINADGYVSRINITHDVGAGKPLYGWWSPFHDPRTINLDLPNMGSAASFEEVHGLRQQLEARKANIQARLNAIGPQALKEFQVTPDQVQAAFGHAEQAIQNAASNLNPETLLKWIAAHEALHATFAKIYDYPTGGVADSHPDALGNAGRGVEAVHMVAHMDSTPEGKAWLDHAATQMGLKGQVGQLRMLTRSVGDTRGNDLYTFFKSLPTVTLNKIGEAHEAVNEALVHATLTGKGLSPYPYLFHSGEKTHAISFFRPEATTENARLATAYYDRYRTAGIPEAAPETGVVEPAGLPAGINPADRSANSAPADQARLGRVTPEGAQAALEALNAQRAARVKGEGLGSFEPGWKKIVDAATSRPITFIEAPDGTRYQIQTSNHGSFGRVAGSIIDLADGSSIDVADVHRIVDDKGNVLWQRETPIPSETPTPTPATAPTPVTAPNDLNPLFPHQKEAIAKEALRVVQDLNQQIDAARRAKDKDLSTSLELERYLKAMMYNKLLEAPTRVRDVNELQVTDVRPINYEGEAQRLQGIHPDNYLSPLRDLAANVNTGLAKLNQAVASGGRPADVQGLKMELQWNMAKFRSAYDLYSSRAFKDGIDKQSYDWKNTRTIANRVKAIQNLLPREQAQVAVRLLSEQARKPYTLQNASQAIRNTSLGLSKEAKNWHPEFKKLLAGEMWHTVKQVYDGDPRLPLGAANIPAHELVSFEDYQALHDRKEEIGAQRADERKKTQMTIDQAKILEKRGTAPKGTVAKMVKDQAQYELNYQNERARLAALIDNHPESRIARQVNAPAPTPDELMPAEELSLAAHPDQFTPVQQMIAAANNLNARIAVPSPDGFSLESFLDEGRPSAMTEAPNAPEWFTPDWGKALTDMRELGGDHKLVADLVQDHLMKMGEHLDPSRNMWHPKQWFKAHWEALTGIPQRVSQIETVLNRLVEKSDDENFSKSVLQAIDNTNDIAQKRLSGELTADQSAVANLLNQYWKTTTKLFTDDALGAKPLIGKFVEDYVPHVILKDPDGNDLYNPQRARWSSRADAAKHRMENAVTSEPLFRTLQDFENLGYTVEWNLAKVFGGHANSTFRMMKMTEMKNTLSGNLYYSPDGKFVGFPIVSDADLLKMKRSGDPAYKGLDVFDDPKAKVRWGPGDSLFQGYRVHPELAREIEKLAKLEDMPGAKLASGLRKLGGLFKFVEFSINPRHAFNIFSNIANLHSPSGVFSPRLWTNVYGRANRALLPEQQGSFFRNISSRGDAAKTQRLINEQSRIEKQMHDLQSKMQAIGDDPGDYTPWSMTPEQGILRDQYDQQRQELIAQHQQLDQLLGARDRDLLATLMDKGLVPDREIIDSADLSGLSNVTEHIPGIGHFHRWMWRDVVWRGQAGIAMHLADQFTMKAAKDYGWDGRGGAVRAETFLTPEMIDGVQRKAVDYAKQGTAMLNKLDMDSNWQLWGRATLLSAPWTMGQLQASRDMLGNNQFSRLLGRGDWTKVSDKMLESGFRKPEAKFIDDMHTKLARRMMISGAAKLAMTATFMQVAGQWLYTGQPGNPISNFLRDPMHTFDVYQGKNPATGTDMWMDNPFFGFQHEMMNYALSGVKKAMEGKSPWEVGVAPLAHFSNKNNPILRNMIDLGFGIETSRWLAGMDPSMSSDTDFQNLHRALDTLGVPDFGSVEDRMIYALRSFPRPPFLGTGTFPYTAIKRNADLTPVLDEKGQQISLTDPKSILNDFGFGGVTSAGADIATGNPSGALGDVTSSNFWFSNLGTSSVAGSKPLYDLNVGNNGIGIQQDPTGFFPAQAKSQMGQQLHAENEQQKQTLVEIANLATSGKEDSWAKIAELRDQYGLTDRQVTDAIIYGASANIGSTSARGKGFGATSARAGIVTINGQQLSEDQSLQYNKTLNNRQLYALQTLQQDPEFMTADSSTKAMLTTQFMNVAEKFTSTQAGQQLFGTGGEPLSDEQYKQLIQNVSDSRGTVLGALQLTPEYQNAGLSGKNQMYQSYLTMASTLAWNSQFGDLKGISTQNLQSLVSNSVTTDAQAQEYLKSTPFFQASTPAEQQAMTSEYSNLAKQMTMNIYNGKTQNMQAFQLPVYMKAIVNTEETAKYLLHDTDVYQMASLKDQQGLDAKYTKIARNLAQKDWSNGQPILNLNQAGQSFSVGPEQLVVGHLMAEQGFSDLQTAFGGKELINSYAQQETVIRKDIKENVVAPPATLTRMQNIAVAAFERANPQYSDYKKAKTNWERRTDIGRLYMALNADEQSLATVETSGLADSSLVTNDLSQVLDTGYTPEEMAIGLGGT